MDASYGLVLVEGSLDHVAHGFSAEVRFRVWREIRLGAGYMGRFFADGLHPDDDYAGHALRFVVTGRF